MRFARSGFSLVVTAMLLQTTLAAQEAATTAPATEPASAEPPPPRRVAFVGEEKSVQLEVKQSKTGHLFVKPTIDGKDAGWWFLDTGAGINCIDTALADELKLAVLREGTANGMGGEAKTRYRAIESLALGPVLLEGSEAIELDLSSFEKFMGLKVSGIIGYDTFFAGIFEIDHRGARVIVHQPESYELKDAEWLPIQILDRRPSIEGQIEGHPAGAMMIDSGSNTGAIVSAPTVRDFDLLSGRELKTSLQGGVGGINRQKSGQLADISLGKVHLKHVDAIFSEAKAGNASKDQYQAILGIPILKQFVMIVNYPQMRMALRLNHENQPTTRP